MNGLLVTPLHTLFITMNKFCALACCMTGAILLLGVAGLANSAPRAESQVVYVLPGQPVAFRLHGSDPDRDALTFRVTGMPLSGTLSGSAPDLVYTPKPGFTERDHLTFLIQDPFGEFDIGLVEFRLETLPAIVRVGPPEPSEIADSALDPIATTLTELGVRLWYVVASPTLTCATGEKVPFLIAGWTAEPKVLALGLRGNPTLVHLSWDQGKCLLDVSHLPAGSYVIVAVLGTKAVSFPAVVLAERTGTQVAYDPFPPGR